MIDVKSINDIDIAVSNDSIVLLLASTKKCNVCTAIKPKIEEMLLKYPKIQALYVLVDDLQEVAGQFTIFTVPTVCLFVEGKEVHRESRFIDMMEMEKQISRYYEFLY